MLTNLREGKVHMKYFRIIFSPTGGTEKAASALTANWKEAETIDLSLPDKDYSEYKIGKDDIALIAMPSFGGLAPQTALERLGQIKGGSARCIIMAVYGNRAYEDTLVQMEDAAEKCGFRIIAAVSAIAEHSIIHRYAAGRPDSSDCDVLAGFAEKIKNKIEQNDMTKPHIPGNRPYKKVGGVGLAPKAGSACTECGLCASGCPTKAISPDKIKTADSKKCISCMRCVSICPNGARKVSRLPVFAASLAIRKACSEPKQNELFTD